MWLVGCCWGRVMVTVGGAAVGSEEFLKKVREEGREHDVAFGVT